MNSETGRVLVYANQVKTFLWKIYTYAFLDLFILLFTSYSLYFRDSGLEPLQIGALFGVLPLTTLLCEVPTGVLADKYSRRMLLSIAQLIRASGFAMWILFPSYMSFIIGFALWGFSTSLISGTFESFIYDELKYFGRETEYERVRGKVEAFRFVGLMLATFFGGFIALHSYEAVFIPSIIVPIVSAVLILTTRPVHSVRSTGERKYWHILREAFTEFRGNSYLLLIVSYFVLCFGVIDGSEEFWVLYFRERGVGLAGIGVILGVVNAVTALAGFTTHYWKTTERSMYLLMLIAGIAAINSTLFRLWITIPLSLLFSYVAQVAVIKSEARVQHAVQSHQRATVLSIRSLLAQLVTLGYFLAVGYFSEKYGYVSFFWIVGGVIAVLSALYIFIKHPKQTLE